MVKVKMENFFETNNLGVNLYEIGVSTIHPRQARIYPSKFDKTWMAEITGIDPKFGFKREFVKADRDNIVNNGRLDGYYMLFPLKAGSVYELRNATAVIEHQSKDDAHYSLFFAVSGGLIFELDKGEVRKLLGMPTKTELRSAVRNYASDDINF